MSQKIVAIDNLSDKQRKAAEMMVSMDYANTKIKDIAEALNINRRTISLWKQQPEFMKYLESLRNTELEKHLRDVDAAVVKKARNGDMAAARMFYDRLGLLNQVKDKADGIGSVNIIIDYPNQGGPSQRGGPDEQGRTINVSGPN